jgi:alkanesulfonate monooxygenase SsuD/methylene tetrahydromethanopterin reductase-like flavin-dependent oxidoreductase (luciferase family)
VSPVYIRTPATIAAATGTVAQLAPGRFILGLGASSHAIVGGWHGRRSQAARARRARP